MENSVEVTAQIQELATKHNEGKPQLSLIPQVFWNLQENDIKGDPKLYVQKSISSAAHATNRTEFLVALNSAWRYIRRAQGISYAAYGLADVMEFGCKKYTRNNWKNGFKYTHMLDAALRHSVNYHTCDTETGLHHWKHIIFCLMMLFHMIQNGTGVNDLEWSDEKSEQEIHNHRLGDGESQVSS